MENDGCQEEQASIYQGVTHCDCRSHNPRPESPACDFSSLGGPSIELRGGGACLSDYKFQDFEMTNNEPLTSMSTWAADWVKVSFGARNEEFGLQLVPVRRLKEL